MYTWLMAAVLVMALFMGGNIQGNKKYILLSCFLMFVLCGLRDVYEIGIDSASSYIRIFREHGVYTWNEVFSMFGRTSNAGFSLILKTLYTLTGGNYQIFFIIYTAFFMSVYAWFIQKYSCNPVQSFAYFWGLLDYIFLFDSIKQGIAMMLCLMAFHAIMERKPVRFILLAAAAAFIHAPALIFMPAYWIAKMKAGRNYLLILAGMLVLTYLFRDSILELMLNYYGTEMQMHDMNFLGNKVLIMLVIIIAAMVLRPPNAEDRMYCILLQFMGIAAVIQTFASYNNTFERLANYYFQFSTVFIPLVFQRNNTRSLLISQRNAELVKTVGPYLFSGFGVWRFANFIQNAAWIWLPYRFFFQ